MATAPKYTVAAPQIFQSDPLEQAFARQITSDPTMSGTMYSAMLNAGMRRDMDEQEYMKSLGEANRMQVMLAQQDMDNEMVRTALTHGPDWVKAGVPVEDIPLIARLSKTGGLNPQTADASELVNALKRAQIYKDYMTGANAGSDNFTFKIGVDPTTGMTYHEFGGKTRSDPAGLQAELNARAAAQSGFPPPPAPTTPTVPNPSRGATPQQQRQIDAQRRARGQHTVPGTQY